MKRAGYSGPESVSVVAASSAMGILVPPCLTMVVLGSLVNLSIVTLFLAGLLQEWLPGLSIGGTLLGIAFTLYIAIVLGILFKGPEWWSATQARRADAPDNRAGSIAQSAFWPLAGRMFAQLAGCCGRPRMPIDTDEPRPTIWPRPRRVPLSTPV